MRINKFKLLKGGEEGIEIEADEFFAIGKHQIKDSVKRTRKIMISEELRDEIRKLKYYFMNLTGHWLPPFNNYYDEDQKNIKPVTAEAQKTHLLLKDLWNKVIVTGAKSNETGFLLTGTIEAVDGKPMGMATAWISADDDVGFFLECLEVLNEVSHKIVEYINDVKIPIDRAKKMVPESMLKGKETEEEIAEAVIEYMTDRGMIVIASDDQDMIGDGSDKSNTELHQKTGDIDSSSKPEAEEVASGGTAGSDYVDDEDTKRNNMVKEGSEAEEAIHGKQVEKKDPYGAPAADLPADVSGDVPVEKKAGEGDSGPQDLTDMEHSANMTGQASAPIEGEGMEGQMDDEEEW